MPIMTTVDCRRRLIVRRMTGKVSDQDFAASFDEYLEHRRHRPDFSVLVDLGEADFGMEIGVGSAVLRHAESRSSKLGSGYRAAIVASGDVNFGVARIYQARMSQVPIDTEVFRSSEDALRWLSETSGDRHS